MNKQNAFRRGFTLIELMIVIVILGILMGTILPRLTGAQARARDTARKADLTNISQALEVFYGDTGSYPLADTARPCLDASNTETSGAADAAKKTSYDLSQYLKGKKIPTPPSTQQNTLGCTGMYYYKPLFSGGVVNASYVLASDIETWQLANFRIPDADSIGPDAFVTDTDVNQGHDASTYIDKIGPLTGGDSSNVNKTIYVVIP
jgi:type II secretion system protein G